MGRGGQERHGTQTSAVHTQVLVQRAGLGAERSARTKLCSTHTPHGAEGGPRGPGEAWHTNLCSHKPQGAETEFQELKEEYKNPTTERVGPVS